MKKGAWQTPPKKPRGRRPRSSEPSNIKITMRLTPDEHYAFQQAAGKKAITVWLRDLGNLCAAGRVRVEAA